jgi:hypothetical protein
MRKVFLWCLMAALPGVLHAAIADRIAAVIERQVLTVSEVSQMVELRFFPRTAGQSDDAYRREVLDNLIAQALRYRDVERFGAQDISKDVIEARLREIQSRFASAAEFEATRIRQELTLDEVRALIKRQLQVEAYIQERFSPLIFVSSDEIQAYYDGPWSQQRRARGLPIPPLADVREEIRSALKSSSLQKEIETWTTQLRSHVNVDIYAWK